MTFFANGALNRANLHVAIAALAQHAGGVFVLVYLLKAGVPAPLVLCTLAGMTAARLVVRPSVLPLAKMIGIRRILIFGTILEAIPYVMLPHIKSPGAMLCGLIAISSIGSALYWTCYHAYYAGLGDDENRGVQVGGREATIALAGIVAPIIGGLAIVSAGPHIAFYGVAIVQVCAALPLIGARDVTVADAAMPNRRDLASGATLFAVDGWFAASFVYVWQIALFPNLGEKFTSFGGALALAGLVSAVMSLIVGKMSDLGHGARSVYIAYGAAAVAVCLQAAALCVPGGTVAANAFGAVAMALTAPTLMTRVYSMSKASGCPLRFAIATEGGWDIGCTLGCLVSAALLWASLDFTAPLLLALLGAALACRLLLSSYGQAAE